MHKEDKPMKALRSLACCTVGALLVGATALAGSAGKRRASAWLFLGEYESYQAIIEAVADVRGGYLGKGGFGKLRGISVCITG
jgi:hypothetical protein